MEEEINTSSKRNPLIDNDTEQEFNNLKQNKKIFKSSIDKLLEDMNKINHNEPSSVQKIKNQFETISQKIKTIANSVNYLKNFITSNEQLTELKKISDSVFFLYQNAYNKVSPILQKEQELILNEISNSNNETTSTTLNDLIKDNNQLPTINSQLINYNPKLNAELKLRSLKEAQKDLENIQKITQSLNETANNMKMISIMSHEKIDSIEDAVLNIDENIHRAHEEIVTFHESHNSISQKKSSYLYIAIIIVLIILLIGLILFLKTSYTSP